MTPEEIEIANALRYLATDDAALEFAVDRIMRRWDEIIIMDAARDTVKRWRQKRAPTARGRVERPKATNLPGNVIPLSQRQKNGVSVDV